MKQLWSAVILLGVMILVLGWNGSRLGDLIKPLQETLDQATQAAKAGEWEKAEQLTRQVTKSWKESVSYLHLVQSHREVDEVTILLEESLEYIVSQSTNTYSALNIRVQSLMDGICKMEKLSVGNLM